MTLEDEIAENIARKYSEQLDFDIMKDLLTDAGWYTVELSKLTSIELLIDINDWVSKKSKQGFIASGQTFIFKCKKEAEWFSLRWL